MTVQMRALPGQTSLYGLSGTLYVPDANGLIAVNPGDVIGFLNSGTAFPSFTSNTKSAVITPAAASAAATVASGALSNGTKSIAAQPDVPRPITFIMGAGGAAVTAGNVAITYIGNDGAQHVENVSTIMASGGSKTYATLFGVALMQSVVISGVAGGSSPFIYGGTTAAVALLSAPGSTIASVYREDTDGTSGTVGTFNANGIITPTTAPNATHTYSWGYTMVQGS